MYTKHSWTNASCIAFGQGSSKDESRSWSATLEPVCGSIDVSFTGAQHPDFAFFRILLELVNQVRVLSAAAHCV